MNARTLARAAFGALLLCAPIPATANDASFEGSGATVFAVQETRVRMAHERVRVRWEPRDAVDAAGKALRDEAPWVTEAVYTFQNVAGRDATVQMGHPDWRRMGDRAATGPEWALRDFRVEVAGQAVEAVHKVVTAPPGGRRKLLADRYVAAWTWDVTIPAKGRVEVRNTYRTGGFESNGPFRECAGDPPAPAAGRAFWSRARPGADGTDFANGMCAAVSYVTSTGRTWAGPIGEADIEIDLQPGVPVHLAVPAPAATSISGGKVRWHFRNWTPRGEVSVLYARPIPDGRARLPAIETVAQARAWRAFARANGVDAATLAAVRDWTAAALARRHDDPAVVDFVKRYPWHLEGEAVPPVPADRARGVIEVLGQGIPAE